MSTNDKSASAKARAEPPTDFVYDFLYNDTRRVSSFLGQLDPSGTLTGIKQLESAQKSEGETASFNPTLNVAVFRASSNLSQAVGSSGSEGSERTYDPLWANALNLLDMLDQKGFLIKTPRAARIGQLLIVKGKIMLADLGFLQSAWEKPAIKKAMMSGVTLSTSSLKKERYKQMNTQKDNFELFTTLITLLPHSLQARIIGDNVNLWCTLEEQFIVGRSSDLILKHGALLAGEWNLLGILDAIEDTADSTTDDGNPISEVLAEIAGTAVGQLAVTLGPIAQSLLGRPRNALGVTPLLIFREIAPEQ